MRRSTPGSTPRTSCESFLGCRFSVRFPSRPAALAPSKQLATLADPSGASTEAFRILKNNLEISQLEHHAGSIAITSASEEEGGSPTAANLAVILARSDRRVILADLNLRHPSIARLFGLRERPGLTGVGGGRPAGRCAQDGRRTTRPTESGRRNAGGLDGRPTTARPGRVPGVERRS